MYVNKNGYYVNNRYAKPSAQVKFSASTQHSQMVQQYNQASVTQPPISVLDKLPIIKARIAAKIKAVSQVQAVPKFDYKNDLRTMFMENKAVIYAMITRTFNAKDKDKNGLIETGEQSGTFINAVERLDELKGYGINTLHILPIHPPGKKKAFGTAGSIYAPADYLQIDPMLRDINDPRDVKEQFRYFIQECHKRGIKVMLDLPSCASLDMYIDKPELMAKDAQGIPKIPQGWLDIRMFEPWANKEKKILNPALLDMHKKYVDMYMDLGIDGLRVDVARAKPVEFWDQLIPYARNKDPEFAFLAESYTYEDASPMANMYHDRPDDLLRVGFDSYYGQYHIFNSWDSKEFHKNMIDNIKMTHKMPKGKSLIGSFATHDDKSPMSNGGVPYCNLTTGLQETLPMTNPYFVTGFESGDRYIYDYKDKQASSTSTENDKYIVHSEKVDIFNLSRRPGGNHPEIGDFMSKMIKVRKQYEDIITKGSYIPLKVKGDKDNHVIAYARNFGGRTLLIIANKDVNASEVGIVNVPGIKEGDTLVDLAPSYGIESKFVAVNGGVKIKLGPARFHMFEINTPNIERQVKEIYKQNL